MRDELSSRCAGIEEAYEFMLAYAAQGLEGDSDHPTARELRRFLEQCDRSLTGIGAVFRKLVDQERLSPAEPYRTFGAVLERDAGDAQAAVRLVLAQPVISSQLVDNLNASIHLRALLTDLFLIDEVLKARRSEVR